VIPHLGEAYASARHITEWTNGLRTLELPFSRLASTRSFACFAGEIFSQIEDVHRIYHSAREEYRLHHRIKNHLQPLPELGRQESWLEAPFWAWRSGNSRRSKLFVRRSGDAWALRAGKETWPDLPAANAERLSQAWQALATVGCKVRPRALTTTMFARLFLADLFIHGIGGGKYDELTDALIGNTRGCKAPVGAGNLLNVNPMLGPLANNGGPTQTHALLTGSVALDSASPAPPGSGGNSCERTDQRGVLRPQNGRCDMGAYERRPGIPHAGEVTGEPDDLVEP
jgi:hypothetical protein